MVVRGCKVPLPRGWHLVGDVHIPSKNQFTFSDMGLPSVGAGIVDMTTDLWMKSSAIVHINGPAPLCIRGYSVSDLCSSSRLNVHWNWQGLKRRRRTK